MSSMLRLVLAASFVLLAACGGGGGGVSSASESSNPEAETPVSDPETPEEEPEVPVVEPEPEPEPVNPEIGAVFSDIFNYHPSTYQKFGVGDAERIAYSLAVSVDDPQGRATLAEAYIYNELSDDFFQLIGGEEDISLDENYDALTDTYQIRGVNPATPDSVQLQGWNVYARDEDGNETLSEFSLSLPGGARPETESVVYSPLLASPPANSVAALENLTVADNSLSFSVDAINEFFNIRFTTSDTRAKSYVVLFYDNAASPNYLGRASALTSDALDDTLPLQDGVETNLILPFSELDDSINPASVDGIHVILLDEAIDFSYAPGNAWHSFLSYSEYLTL